MVPADTARILDALHRRDEEQVGGPALEQMAQPMAALEGVETVVAAEMLVVGRSG